MKYAGANPEQSNMKARLKMEKNQFQTEEKVLTLFEKLIDELNCLNAALAKIEANKANGNRPMLPKEAAAYLGISYDCLLRWARDGIIPSAQPGGHRVLFTQKALDQCLEHQASKSVKKSDPDEKTYGKLRKITV
jgi:excisionase family DNA binding protein